ncbi:hypothetical protein EIP86_002007 [Pleurotus ostreatoroseus]|nr:hypothetical protein EIP86_002007 [Pleurotus ostreatoroseus]
MQHTNTSPQSLSPYASMDTFSFTDIPQHIIASSMPTWMIPASAPPSPHVYDAALYSYQSNPTMRSSPYTATHPLFTPQYERPSSLPEVSTLHTSMAPYGRTASYPPMLQTTPTRRAFHPRHRDLRTFYSHSSLEPSHLNIPIPFPPRSRSPIIPSRPMREKIPQTLLASPDRNFKVEFAIRGVAGVRLSDALSEFAELDDGESRPFTNNGSRQIRLVIKWPGYEEFGTYVPVKEKISSSDEVFVTRKRFAYLLSERIKRFFKKANRMDFKEDCKKWKIGNEPGAIKFDDIWLVYVARASNNVWMAELELESRLS